MGILVKLLEKIFSYSENQTPKGKYHKNSIICKKYYVKGKNPETNRFKTNLVVVEASETTETIQQKSGLLPPFEITEIIPDGVTEAQAAYAKKLGLILPNDATKEDASIFLTRYNDNKPLHPPAIPKNILCYLISKNIYVPAYAGMEEAHYLYFQHIDLNEKIAYFGMKVYCNLKKLDFSLLEDFEPEQRERFYEFANQFKNNKEFTKSLSYYSGNDLPLNSNTISKKLKAYNMAVDFFVK